ncbi:V-type ATP synthase subunit I [Clostridium paraputrificum]|uniref:V-type ATP synthase subunit I n=1 Tax=Clostridium TaxID=1485 RepID=UPI003D335C6D
MAIVKMNKFTLLAFESQRARLLEKLQGLAEVEFINLQDEDVVEKHEELADLYKDSATSDYAECEDKLSMAKFALQFLMAYVPQKSGLKEMKEGKRELTFKELEDAIGKSEWEEVYHNLKVKEKKISDLENEQTKLQTVIDSLEPWEGLDTSFELLNSLKTPHFLGSIPKQYEETLVSELQDCYLEIISSNNQDLFFLLICDNDKEEEISEKLRGFGFSQFKTDINEVPIKVIHDYKDKIAKLDSNKFFVIEELAGLEEEVTTFKLVCEYYENIRVRKDAINNFLKTENVMIIQGWIPEEENNKLVEVAKEVLGDTHYLNFEDVKEDEISDVPVKLKNNEINSAFENIVQMYSTPRYDEIDPTPLMAPFYLLFFGMMVADIGYGIIQLIVTLFVLKKFKLDEEKEKFAKFFFYLSFPIIGFGAIYGSFFGGIIDLPKLVDPNKDVTTVLIASVVFGAIQIFFGLGVKAYMLIKAGKPKDAFYDVGAWVITLVSVGLVLGAGALGLPPVVKTISIVAMIFGMVVIVLTGGREEASTGARLGQGAYALYGITGYVGDLVSYTRLMALGLAGGSLAGAFNLMMGMIPGAAAILFAPMIFILGHVFNLGLGLLGAYVHTCRLQYVEYFGKFYEGGGKSFSPFKTKNEYINLKKN